MNDWARGIETQNYGITRRMNRKSLMELLQVPLTLSILGMICFFYLWQRSQITTMGYEIQKLQEIERSLARVQKSLILEAETLKDPQRIDEIARNVLKMSPVRPHQIIPAAYPVTPTNDPTRLALAGTADPVRGTRRFVSTH